MPTRKATKPEPVKPRDVLWTDPAALADELARLADGIEADRGWRERGKRLAPALAGDGWEDDALRLVRDLPNWQDALSCLSALPLAVVPIATDSAAHAFAQRSLPALRWAVDRLRGKSIPTPKVEDVPVDVPDLIARINGWLAELDSGHAGPLALWESHVAEIRRTMLSLDPSWPQPRCDMPSAPAGKRFAQVYSGAGTVPASDLTAARAFLADCLGWLAKEPAVAHHSPADAKDPREMTAREKTRARDARIRSLWRGRGKTRNWAGLAETAKSDAEIMRLGCAEDIDRHTIRNVCNPRKRKPSR